MDDEMGGTWLERAVDRAMAICIESAPMRELMVVPTTHGSPEVFDRQLHRSHELVFQSACALLVRYFDGAEGMEGLWYGNEAGYGERADYMADAGDGDQAEWSEGGVRPSDPGCYRSDGIGYEQGEEGCVGEDGTWGSLTGDSGLPGEVGFSSDTGSGGAGDTGDRGGSRPVNDVGIRAMFFAITVQCSAGCGVQVDRESSSDGDTQAG